MAAFLLLPADAKDLLHLVGHLILLLSCLVCLMFYKWILSAHNFFWTCEAQYENFWIFGNRTSCHTLVRKKLSSVYELWSRKYVILLKCLTCFACIHYTSECQFLYMTPVLDIFCSGKRISRLYLRSHATKKKAIENMLMFLWTAWSPSSLGWIPIWVPVFLPHLGLRAGLITILRPQVPVDLPLTTRSPLLRFFRLTCSSLSIMGRC